jgi:glycine cleavage system H protein
MYKIKTNDKGEIKKLIYGPDAVTKWVLADIEKYKK